MYNEKIIIRFLIKVKMGSFKLKRVTGTYTSAPFELTRYIEGNEKIEVGNNPREIDYIIGMVPLDCVDDITQADKYNPRAMRPQHRDELMEQMGTYGLLSPLVAILEKSVGSYSEPKSLYLIDGRHRFNGLIELDPKLKSDLQKKEEEEEKKKYKDYISSKKHLREPKHYSTNTMKKYTPQKESIGSNSMGSPMVPIKIYLEAEQIESIGMAIFLNRGQKKLSGGEKIAKVAVAFDLALDRQRSENLKKEVSEIEACNLIQNVQDNGDIIASWIVSRVSEESDSFWFDVVGRWQGEKTEDGKKIKPLTSNNFLTFVRNLIDDSPKDVYNQKQRDLEIQNLIRLGEIFYKIFDWPNDIPDHEHRYTATSVLCRSFLIDALGRVLNDLNGKGSKKILSENLDSCKWDNIRDQIFIINREFKFQSVKRKEFEDLKQELNMIEVNDPQRESILINIDKLRGELWTLDTIVATLKGRIESILKKDQNERGVN